MKYFIIIFLVLSFYSTESYSDFNNINSNNGKKDISDYSNIMLKAFTPNDGLPQSSIMSMAIDSKGYLWIGTQDGAAYYDGRKWITVNLPDRTISNYVLTIFPDSDNSIWFSADRGDVHNFKSSQWKSYGIKDGLASNIVFSIQETIDNKGEKAYWFGTTNGLTRYYKGKWKTFNTKNSSIISDYIYSICKTSDGSLWIGTLHGVSHFFNDTFQNVDLPEGLRGNVVDKIMQGKNGELWFAGIGVIGRYENKKWKVFQIKNTKKNSRIFTMFESSKGDLWFGSANGIMKIPKASNSNADTMEDFLVGRRFENLMGDIFSITETRGGEIWFGTLLGLFRYIPGKWRTLDEKTGLQNTSITYMYETSKGDYLFGTPRGISIYHNSSWKIIDDKSGLSNNFIKSILEAKDGTIWIGTLGGGVDHLINGRWNVYEMKNGLADNRIYSMLQSKDGTLWFATANGVSKYLNGKWSTITTSDGLAGNQVMSMYQSKDGTMWFGTRSGLSSLYDGKFKTYNTSNGLCGNIVQSINTTSDGSIWFGTTSGGISRYYPQLNKWQTYNDTTDPALSNNSVYQVEEDHFKRLYFLTNKGVTRFSPEVWLTKKEKVQGLNKKNISYVENFSVEDGLPSNEGMVRASMTDSKGRIWIGTTLGAGYFDPAQEITDTLQKNLLIERISIQKLKDNTLIKNGIKLSYYENNISFEYALLSYFKESKTLYKSQLEPYEESSDSWSNNYRKEYTNLPNGKYVFHVWGMDYAGNVTGPIDFTFIINPPFWKEWWFIAVLFLIFIGIIYETIRFITNLKLKKQMALLERQKLIEKERGRISKDMHDTVGSSLTRIAILSDRVGKQVKHQQIINENYENTMHWTELIGTTAREVIDTMNEIIWSLSPKQDNLESLINYSRHFINSMFESTDIEYKLEVPESIPNIVLTPDFRRNIFLIIKEIINNIVKHSKASNVSLSISIGGNNLSFEAKDDGIGINSKVNEDNGKVGFGLKNMKERSESIGAELDIESLPNKGTKIRISIPLQKIPPI